MRRTSVTERRKPATRTLQIRLSGLEGRQWSQASAHHRGIAFIGLPRVPYGAALFPSFVAVLDIVLVFLNAPCVNAL